MGFIENIKNENEKNKKRREELKKINPTCILPLGTVSEIGQSLRDDENILYFTRGNGQSIFCTNKRIIILYINGMKQYQKQIPIEKISSIVTQTGLMYGKIKITDNASSKIVIDKVVGDDAKIFVNKVNEQMENYKSFKIEINNTTEKDITDKIEKLAELHKEGILTDYEFATKKMELLEKLKK